MATVNISFYVISKGKFQSKGARNLLLGVSATILGMSGMNFSVAQAAEAIFEPIQACVFARDVYLTPLMREQVSRCLGWQEQSNFGICSGQYTPISIQPLADPEEIQIYANNQASLHEHGQSKLNGHVEVRQNARILNAQTAYIYRDAQSQQVTQITLLGDVTLLEPGRVMIAKKVTINAQDKSGKAEEVIYRFNDNRPGAALPAWGQASFIERFANQDYLLQRATYSTCAPNDNAWHIEAKKIILRDDNATGYAHHGFLKVGDVPIFYFPYLSFPTSNERRSGFLMPYIGNSNTGGFNLAVPYYWNMAPNYDAVITPQIYSKRGLMLAENFRYITPRSIGSVNGRFMPHDEAFSKFIQNNKAIHPKLRGDSTDRWSIDVKDITQITPDLQFRMNVQGVSDDYFLEDFGNSLAVLTERQLLREANLTFLTDNWVFRGMVESYQTLQPFNQTPIAEVYQRLPQLMARGSYDDLFLGSSFTVLGQYDNFKWPNNRFNRQEGPRYYVNPVLSLPQLKPWGYFTPSVELVQSYYDVYNFKGPNPQEFQRSIPRYSVDSGLYFEKSVSILGNMFTQTLEPRVYYLNVPFYDQTQIPIYDSGDMIFTTDQLFRNNRFSGYDRIGDANQLAYAVTSRWISEKNGSEKANFTIGQIHYFEDRRVFLCQRKYGGCVQNPLSLGFLSPTSELSPIAARAVYHFNPFWVVDGGYVYDVDTDSTNNSHMNFHYQPAVNQMIGVGYTYLLNGDITQIGRTRPNVDPLHQVSFSFAWPLTDRWSSLGAYGYNISKQYEMMSVLGIQYDNCCWALRMMAGRSFQNLSPTARPQYTNNVYLQILLKGLGAVGNSDPNKVIRTYIPGYMDNFHRS